MVSKAEYKTNDLALAAAIVSSGAQLVRTERLNAQKVTFIFYDEGNLTNIIDAFWADRLTINARTMFDNIKMLKTRIYEGRS